jgi:hypothetical protein
MARPLALASPLPIMEVGLIKHQPHVLRFLDARLNGDLGARWTYLGLRRRQ